jgi:hypothetical protein
MLCRPLSGILDDDAAPKFIDLIGLSFKLVVPEEWFLIFP